MVSQPSRLVLYDKDGNTIHDAHTPERVREVISGIHTVSLMDKVNAPWRWSVSDDRRCTVIYDADDRPVAWLIDDDVADHVCGLVNLGDGHSEPAEEKQ